MRIQKTGLRFERIRYEAQGKELELTVEDCVELFWKEKG